MDPPYKCSYCGFLFRRQCKNYLNHECFQDRLVPNKTFHVLADDANVLRLVEVFKAIPSQAPVKSTSLLTTQSQGPPDHTSADEALIAHVYARRPLWDHRLPIKERTNLKLTQIWMEISNEMEGGFSPERLKKRWRQLRDDFVRARKKAANKARALSGANPEQPPPKPAFRFYDTMKFLIDGESTVVPKTRTTLKLETDAYLVTTSPNWSVMSPSPSTSTGKRKRAISDNMELEPEVVETLQVTETQPDGVDGFSIMLGEALRRLPYRNRTRMQIQIMQMLDEEESRLQLKAKQADDQS